MIGNEKFWERYMGELEKESHEEEEEEPILISAEQPCSLR